MDASLLKKPNITDFNSFIELKAKASSDTKGTLNKAAKQFEAIFMQRMIKSMRQSNSFLSDDSPLKSKQVENFQEMLDQQRSLEMASGGNGIGIADMMINQLDKSKQAFEHKNRPMHINGTNLPGKLTDLMANIANRDTMIVTPQDFVKAILPAAKQFAKQLGVDPKMLVAQAIHETGWGNHMVEDENGQSSFNLFNIKGGGSWDKQQAKVTTTEYIDGQAVKVKEPFRKYDSMQESFQDYVSLIKNNKRYQNALSNSHDAEKYMHQLQQAGYATDPNYADRVIAIYQGNRLENAMQDMEKK